jgi:hypothetical protein
MQLTLKERGENKMKKKKMTKVRLMKELKSRGYVVEENDDWLKVKLGLVCLAEAFFNEGYEAGVDCSYHEDVVNVYK